MQRVIDIHQNLVFALDNDDAVQEVSEVCDDSVVIRAVRFARDRFGYFAEAQALEIFLRPAEPDVRVEDHFITPDLFQAWNVHVVFMSVRQGDDVYMIQRGCVHRLGKDMPLAAKSRAMEPRVGGDLQFSCINQQAGVAYIFYIHGLMASDNAVTIRSAARPSHNSGARAEGECPSAMIASAAATMRSGSSPTSWFVPCSTVIGRSVFSRSVRQGTPRAVVSSCRPPESVSVIFELLHSFRKSR